MIELNSDQLTFTFPEVHPRAKLTIKFQRTLRIPDDEGTYRLPPGLGAFPLQHVDDYAAQVPESWLQRGGVMLPMYQSEAMWLSFNSRAMDQHWVPYPFAIKVATGKQCAVSGNTWTHALQRAPQDYLVASTQPWFDGYVVEKGLIRQFVAMPLGSGYSAEEQITGQADHGGLQLAVYPMKRKVFEKRFPKRDTLVGARRYRDAPQAIMGMWSADMGLAPGGRMRQEVYDDPYELSDWEHETTSRCFVHLCNSLVWQSFTGSHPPHPAPTAKQYTKSGLPWFDYYDDRQTAVDGGAALSKMKSVAELGKAKGDIPLPENQAVTPDNLVVYRKGLQQGQVREGAF